MTPGSPAHLPACQTQTNPRKPAMQTKPHRHTQGTDGVMYSATLASLRAQEPVRIAGFAHHPSPPSHPTVTYRPIYSFPTAGAILDRFLHHAITVPITVPITGCSYRVKDSLPAAPEQKKPKRSPAHATAESASWLPSRSRLVYPATHLKGLPKPQNLIPKMNPGGG